MIDSKLSGVLIMDRQTDTQTLLIEELVSQLNTS